MPGVGIAEQTCPQIEKSHPGGHKHTGVVAFAQLAVGAGKYLVDLQTGLGKALQHGFGRHHKQGGGNSFAGNVGNHKGQRVLIQQIEVIKISAHFFGGLHQGVDAEIIPLGIRREHGGQGRMLDLPGKLQLLVDAGRRLVDIALQGDHGGVDVIGKGGKFLVGTDIDRHIQIAAGDLGQGTVDFLDVLHHQLFDQEVDLGEQGRKHQRFHKGEDIDRHIP